MSIRVVAFFCLSAVMQLCCNNQTSINYANLPAFSGGGHVNAVIEIPAGTNHKHEYDYTSNSFPVDRNKDGSERVIAFLGYPGNYGFIPGTKMDKEKGGDGDALDVLVLGESVSTGTVMEIQPIGTLQLLDGGEQDHKIIAIPVSIEEQVLSVKNITDLPVSVQDIVKSWFLNYKGEGEMEFVGWADANEALHKIEKWQIQAE